MSDTGGPEKEPADVERELARHLLSEQAALMLLETVVRLSVSAVAGVAGASVSLVSSDDGQVRTSNATSAEIRAIDEVQYQDDEGPCVAAIRSGSEVRITLPTDRWPSFSERAEQAGVSTVLSLPLTVRNQTIAGLNLYATGPDALSEAAVGVARALADQASVVLAIAAIPADTELTQEHLQDGLRSRDVIGQAKGILMAREDITADQAFDILRRASQRTNRKLRDIAAEIATHMGESPVDPA